MFSSEAKPHYAKYLIAVIAVSVLVLLIQSLAPSFIRNVLAEVLKPGEQVMNGAGKGARDLWQTLMSINDIKKELQQQKEQNASLQRQIEEAKLYKEENASLRSLLEIRKEYGTECTAVEIIGRDPSNWFERMIIDGGREKGIRKNMVALAPEGLVGQITGTSSSTASVRTILNNRSAVPVYIVESNSYGILYGDGSPLCTIRYIRNISFLKEGHLVVSSGLGDVFPPGIVIGKITKVQGSIDCLSNFAKVRPFVNFDNLRFLMIAGGKS